MPSHPPKLEPGARIGHYLVEALISSGGFGAVYRVTRDGKPFALKVPLTHAGSEEGRKVTEARIVREVVSLMSLKHPGIVGVHGFDRWPDPVTGALYLVMDFVDGQPLKRWREATSPTLREILDVFRQLARAVEAMHAMGVVHRDIKSSNVLVRPTAFQADSAAPDARAPMTLINRTGAPVYEPVLVDFGLARPTFTPDVTAEHVVVGTEGFLAPELLAGTGKHFHYTPATDLYALGRLFFEVLTGFADPYHPSCSLGRRRLRLPSAASYGLTPLLDPIVTDLLAEDAARRTPSAGELARQLEALLADESWGNTLPVRASLFTGKGLDLYGEFVTRAEGNAPPEKNDEAPSAGTAEFDGAPTLPMFVLDSNETLAGKAMPPTAIAPAPAAPAATTTTYVGQGAGRPSGLWRYMKQVLGMLALGWVAWFIVLALLRGLVSVSDAEAASGAPEWMTPAPASTPKLAPRERPSPPQSQIRAASPSRPQTDALRSAPAAFPPPSLMVRAALVGHAQPGEVRAVLRQPVQLAALALPTGTTIEGTADALPDGQFLLRFESARQANGGALPVAATALVDARAAQRRPLGPAGRVAGFEFDLSFAPARPSR